MNQPSSIPRRIPPVIEPSGLIARILAKTASASASSRSVSASRYQEPPSGSATLHTPVSSMITCWVRTAISAAFSLGSASTSSRALVCSELVPPSTAASASIAVRTMLLSGCCAVSDTPAVWVWKRICQLLGLFAPNVSRISRAQPRGAVLGDLLEEVDLRVEEERQARREVIDVEAARDGLLDVGEAVLERERELLLRRRARLADVVSGDRDRMPARHVSRAPLDHVAAEAHRRVDRE